MKRLMIPLLVFWLVVAGLAYFSHMISPDSIPADETTNASEIEIRQLEAKWRNTLEQVDAYYTPPVDDTRATSDATMDNQVNLTDGKVVGIVIGEKSQVYVLQPNQSDITSLLIGEGWLSPWSVSQINADSVVWVNENTNETQTQHLFR